MDDEALMGVALSAARRALLHDDVPIGCCVAVGGEVIAEGENRREVDADPTAHAEVLALRSAATASGSWRLSDATIYVTVEPCVMCAGALLNARVARVVVGAMDEKAGAMGSRYNVLADPRLLHECEQVVGVRAEECAQLLSEFFASRRVAPQP
jgi:tRNA(adenine34) deaminase